MRNSTRQQHTQANHICEQEPMKHRKKNTAT